LGSSRSAKVVMAGEDTQPQTELLTWLVAPTIRS
jgi:hypothetical protein